MDKNVTIVTALWDLGRGNINESFRRGYDSYLNRFSELLKTDIPMYIFISKEDEEFIWQHRKKENTVLQIMSLEELLNWFEFTQKTDEIRKKENWYNQAEWLKNSPQANLKGYNPLVMSKMFMLNNVTIYDPFKTEYFFWIDAGLSSTVHAGYFYHDKVLEKLPNFLSNNNDFVFLTYPYIGGEEIHGFPRNEMARYCNTDYVKYVCRGGFFGGKKEKINEINGIYYSYLSNSLSEGLMGTEESIFTIIMHNHSNLITQFMIEQDGLVWRFFEDIKEEKYKDRVVNKISPLDINNVALYVISYNSPKQFETLIDSMIAYDKNFIEKPKKFLLNNSTNLSTTEKYNELCVKYGFEHIKKDNIGICGGRQFIAEHSDENNFDFHLFFEDDMFFYPNKGEVCKNGFNRYIEDLYNKCLEIVRNENFDFLKLNFSEFFGNNSKQWAWYNVPQNVRESNFPLNPKKTENDFGKEPFLIYKNIKSYKGLPYATGEVYYCNWPQIVSKNGNKKMFIETKWQYPYEQTWMSHIYQETIKNNIMPAVLLVTPTEHNRFEFYPKEDRREN